MFRKILNYVNDTELRINVFKNKVNIVNYSFLLVFDDDRIVVDCGDFILSVIGSSLVINRLFEHEILIVGVISRIEFR